MKASDHSAIAAVVTIGEAEELPALVEGLAADGHEVWLLCNSLAPGPHLEAACTVTAVTSVNTHPAGLYATWNEALAIGRERRRRVAILNDDIFIRRGSLRQAERLMAMSPEYAVVGLDYAGAAHHGIRKVHGSYRHGGVNGAAFLVDPTVECEFDESYEWWFGDDDFFLSVEKAGRFCGVADECRFTHRGEATAVNHPWTTEAKVRDRERFVAKWGNV